MSYIVPRDKPKRCTYCNFFNREYRDCKLQRVVYDSLDKQYKNCPLVEVNETLFSAENARKFLRENPPKEGETEGSEE